ncbi:MAG: VWA domain-containing protein, partial [Lysobacterales bacterium]
MRRDHFASRVLTHTAVQLLALLWLSTPLQADETLPDVRLLIDVSGSMRESDPNNLRAPALELMLRLLPEGSRAGVWTFGQWVNMPVAHREVDEQWREEASRAVAQIHNHGLLTNIPEALKRATYDANRLDYRFKTSIILLTDGKVEVSNEEARNVRAAQELLDKLAIELRDTGIEVHTIALSDNADHEFLGRLAQITGGLAEQAESADELSAVFLQALDIAAPTEQVPLLGGEFLIDDSVEEFTALVFPEPDSGDVTVIDPQQNMFTVAERPAAVRWFLHRRFQLITVVNPEAGEWRIVAPGSQTRVNIISHLSVVLDGPPTSMEAGHSPELGIRLMDSAEVIRDPDLLGLINIVARIYRADNEQWEIQVPTAQVPSSGEYRIALPMLADVGRYE